jgi:hypothetical protein
MGRGGRARTRIGTLAVAALVLAGLIAIGSCSSSGDSFDRAKAVEDVLAEGRGHLTRAQAECYVDRVLQDLGSGALDLGTEPPPERVPRLTEIQIDCIGVVNLGTSVRGSTPIPTDETGATQPHKLGDDPHLDELYRACQAGSGPACDQLFDEAPLGSEYEELAGTCGGRTQEAECAAVYPDPNWPAGSSTRTTPKKP